MGNHETEKNEVLSRLQQILPLSHLTS
jgi:hypothetical protein